MSENDGALLAWLGSNDAPCPVCSYNLRGLKEPRCPECASPLHLAVGSSHFLTGPWILALVSFALAMGFDGVVVTLMSIGGTLALLAEGPPTRGDFWIFGTLYGGFVVMLGASSCGAWFMLRRRKAWLSQAPKRQWRAAAATFAGVFLVHLAFAVTVVMVVNR
jgi:hypothetical protein